MSGLPTWTYSMPTGPARATGWAKDWRRRWLRSVGTAAVHHATGELTLFYSADRPPADRDALRAELEARPNGVAQVYAACRRAADDWNRRVGEANARRWLRRWFLGGGKVRYGARGWVLKQGRNPIEMIDEWNAIKEDVQALVAPPARVRHAARSNGGAQ